jgi:hypothetical protein
VRLREGARKHVSPPGDPGYFVSYGQEHGINRERTNFILREKEGTDNVFEFPKYFIEDPINNAHYPLVQASDRSKSITVHGSARQSIPNRALRSSTLNSAGCGWLLFNPSAEVSGLAGGGD